MHALHKLRILITLAILIASFLMWGWAGLAFGVAVYAIDKTLAYVANRTFMPTRRQYNGNRRALRNT